MEENGFHTPRSKDERVGLTRGSNSRDAHGINFLAHVHGIHDCAMCLKH